MYLCAHIECVCMCLLNMYVCMCMYLCVLSVYTCMDVFSGRTCYYSLFIPLMWVSLAESWRAMGIQEVHQTRPIDNKVTLYCEVSSSHNSWPDVCSLLLCSSCVCTHMHTCIAPICTYTHITLSHYHTCAHTYTLNTHTCMHSATNTCMHTHVHTQHTQIQIDGDGDME